MVICSVFISWKTMVLSHRQLSNYVSVIVVIVVLVDIKGIFFIRGPN